MQLVFAASMQQIVRNRLKTGKVQKITDFYKNKYFQK